MTHRLSSYCVAVLEYDCYELWIDAPNRKAAVSLAQANWEEHGADDWKHTNNDIHSFEIIDRRDVR